MIIKFSYPLRHLLGYSLLMEKFLLRAKVALSPLQCIISFPKPVRRFYWSTPFRSQQSRKAQTLGAFDFGYREILPLAVRREIEHCAPNLDVLP